MKTEKYKISFCTVCMDRLHHLKYTLPKNIQDNINYTNIEFVVINYNSKDNLDGWIKSEMKEYIDLGILNYYKTDEPEQFLMSHSKNIAAKCAKGDIICNVDADNYIGNGFAEYINDEFTQNSEIFLTTDIYNSIRDCCGRICLKKEDFYKTFGYDENMKTYGYEDNDLKNRLEILNLKKKIIKNKKYLKAIEHSDNERFVNDDGFLSLDSIYIYRFDYFSSILLILFKNSTFYVSEVVVNRLVTSTLIDNLFLENLEKNSKLSITNNEKGIWTKVDENIILKEIPEILLNKLNHNNRNDFIRNKKIFLKKTNFIFVENREVSSNMMKFYLEKINLNKMESNLLHKNIKVNSDVYGKAELTWNFKKQISTLNL